MKFWALFSGGKDSTAVVHTLLENGQLEGIVSIDTGIATPDWLPHITQQCAKWGYEPEVIKTTVNYDDLVMKYGFPGPSKHGMFMNYLKGRAICQFRKRHKGAILASGVRSVESDRRFRNTKEWSTFEGVKVWAPLFNLSTRNIWEMMHRNGYQRSPAYETLCISGDCLCGAYATKLERSAIRAFYPSVSERIDYLEAKTQAKYNRWGWGGNKDRIASSSPVCVDCEAQMELPI